MSYAHMFREDTRPLQHIKYSYKEAFKRRPSEKIKILHNPQVTPVSCFSDLPLETVAKHVKKHEKESI